MTDRIWLSQEGLCQWFRNHRLMYEHSDPLLFMRRVQSKISCADIVLDHYPIEYDSLPVDQMPWWQRLWLIHTHRKADVQAVRYHDKTLFYAYPRDSLPPMRFVVRSLVAWHHLYPPPTSEWSVVLLPHKKLVVYHKHFPRFERTVPYWDKRVVADTEEHLYRLGLEGKLRVFDWRNHSWEKGTFFGRKSCMPFTVRQCVWPDVVLNTALAITTPMACMAGFYATQLPTPVDPHRYEIERLIALIEEIGGPSVKVRQEGAHVRIIGPKEQHEAWRKVLEAHGGALRDRVRLDSTTP